MDDILIYLVLGIIYLIFSVMTKGKKKKRVPPPATPSLPGPASAPTAEVPTAEAPAAQPTMGDALREIRVALGMEAPPSPPPVPRSPRTEPPPIQATPRKATHPTRSHGPSVAETAPQKAWPSEFKPIPTHYADETFEERLTHDGDRFGQRRQKPKPPPAKPSPTTAAKAPTPQRTTQRQAPTGVRRSRIMKQLKDPNAAREAFILSEIFGLPHAKRRR